MTSAILMALVITASVPSFRRAGYGFTDKGTAFPADHFDKKQLAAIRKEKRLSVQEMPADAVPEGVDRAPLDLALAAQPETAKETKAPVKKTQSAKDKAQDDAKSD